MRITLQVQVGRKRSRILRLRGPVAVIGRARGNAVRIPSSDVSRRHCQLYIADGLITLEDLDSLNGTYLNDERVEGAQVVRPGDRIQVGPVTLLVQAPDAEPVDVVPMSEEFDVELIDDDLEDLAEQIPPKSGPDFEIIQEKPKKKSGVDSTSRHKTVPAPFRKKPPKSQPVVDAIPVEPGDEAETEKREPVFLEDDQAWELPPSAELRDFFHGMDTGEDGIEE
jgi:predicted component of type VI protein secretion system